MDDALCTYCGFTENHRSVPDSIGCSWQVCFAPPVCLFLVPAFVTLQSAAKKQQGSDGERRAETAQKLVLYGSFRSSSYSFRSVCFRAVSYTLTYFRFGSYRFVTLCFVYFGSLLFVFARCNPSPSTSQKTTLMTTTTPTQPTAPPRPPAPAPLAPPHHYHYQQQKKSNTHAHPSFPLAHYYTLPRSRLANLSASLARSRSLNASTPCTASHPSASPPIRAKAPEAANP